MNKITVYIIIIIFLLVTNIATIITVISLNSKESDDTEPPLIEMPVDRRVGFFHNQVGIREEQVPAFNNYNLEFNVKAGEISGQMRELRHKMVEEMASENPDTSLLNSIAQDFGNLHKELKILTMEYYFNLKSVSDEMQRERLHFMFREMLDPEGIVYGRGRGGAGRGLRRGDGRMGRILQ